MPVEFRLLGDVEVRVDGRPLDVGHARQRCVLVALLVDAGRPVAVDELIYRVWGERPPQRATGVLYGYLSRLRRALADAAPGAIVREHGRYRAAVDPMTVDAHRFTDLVARAEAAGGDGGEALYGEALALWRGSPFSTLDNPWLAGVRERWQRRRLSALLDRNELLLAGGGHATVAQELSAWLDEYPFDERLAEQYMLALYRCGRQVDALLVYQRTRTRLAEELGVDPSPPLRRLHERMLRSDRALLPPAPPARSVPRQLPAAPAAFVGRGQDLTALDAAMAVRPGGAPAIAAISGTGGIGKTWLALHWAHRHRDEYPDGQLYVNLGGFDPAAEPLAPAAALRTFLSALGVAPSRMPPDEQALAGLYRDLMADRRMLVVLDNARGSRQVVPLLPGTPRCAVLVASRLNLAELVSAHGALPVALGPLTDTDARHLLVHQLGAARVGAEPGAVDALLGICAGLPLALAIVAGRAAHLGPLRLSRLAAELAAPGLDALDAGESGASLRAVFACSYEALPPRSAEVFRLMGLVPGPDAEAAAVASLAGLPVPAARAQLRRLGCASLVVEHRPDRYRMHDLVRRYAAALAEEVEPARRLADARHRLLDHYLHSAHAAALRLDPHREHAPPPPPRTGVTVADVPGPDAALAWFTAEHEALLHLVRQAGGWGFDGHVWRLAGTLTTFLDRRGHWDEREVTERAALASARRLGDRRAQAHAHRGLALAYVWLRRYDHARSHLWRALRLFEELDEPAMRAHCYRGMARAWAQQGRHDQALRYDQRALWAYREVGDGHGQAVALNAIGWHHAHLGDYERAAAYCRDALARHERLGDPHALGCTWDSLGYVHHRTGDLPQAIRCYQTSVRLLRQAGDRYLEATVLRRLGECHAAAHRPASAERAWRRALDLLDALHHPTADAVRAKLAEQAIAGLSQVDCTPLPHPLR